MAAAKAPGPADARIPCPLCGGLIHPIAGRCKHCKGDVSATRSSRPAATALPALQPSAPQTNPYAPAAPTNGVNGAHAYAIKAHPANAHMAIPIAMRTDEPASQPILPPRPTGRMQASGTAASSTWKSWPVVVIAIAVVAIITAVILMVWPPGSSEADAKTLAPPPAPERMDTNPLPPSSGPQGSVDPWKTQPMQPAPPAAPDVDIQPPSLADPLRNPSGDSMLAMWSAIAKHACDRLASCPGASDPMKQMCDLSRLAVPNTPPPSCNAARRCLDMIDRLPCDDLDQAATVSMMTNLPACVEAMSC